MLEVKGKTTFGVIISLYANINAILPVFSGGSGRLVWFWKSAPEAQPLVENRGANAPEKI